MINRLIEKKISSRMKDNKALVILGPRQSGKTTLVKQLAENTPKKLLWLNGDEAETREILASPTIARLKNILGNTQLLVIDEAQRIENIGLCIKLVVDNIPGVKVIATGSSSFELANKINEPLTGRKWEFHLLPLSYQEMADYHGKMNENRSLEQRLVFGYFPDVINHPGDEKERLKLLADSYLYKDILTWERILKPERLERLVQMLALQTGQEVSFHELGQTCGLNNETVEKYVTLLEKCFIVYRLHSLSRNLRNELKKSRKVYFYDLGLRNAVVNQFNPVELRNDKGALWENFLVTERLKYFYNSGQPCNRFFWRTLAQQEIDYVEERDGAMHAYEFKWKSGRKKNFSAAFLNAYPGAKTERITRDHFAQFISSGND
ncbi:MAG: ATP-binding protein [Bacteroidia bacterium]|nr:ATP-binding protein [Bacteroidia bacterium]